MYLNLYDNNNFCYYILYVVHFTVNDHFQQIM